MACDDIRVLLDGCAQQEPASTAALARLERWVANELPADYKDLMRRSNGLEGFVNDSQFLAIWPVEQIMELNKAYRVPEFAHGLVLFGSDGGDIGYAFDTRSTPTRICRVPLIGMSLAEVIPMGKNVQEFLRFLLAR